MKRTNPSILAQHLELARRLKAVLEVANPEDGEITIRLDRPRSGGYGFTVFAQDGEPVTAMSEERAQACTNNPAKRRSCGGWQMTETQFWQERTVRALQAQERGAVYFDWLNPRDIPGLLAEAWAYHQWRFRVNAEARGINLESAAAASLLSSDR